MLDKTPRRLSAFALAALFAACAAAPMRVLAQEEIETESITEQGTLDPFAASDDDLVTIFNEADRLFRSFEQTDSIPLFDRLIGRLESSYRGGGLSPELLEMLIQSRVKRAEAKFNLGENEAAATDMRRILELDAGWRLDSDLVSPKLVEMLDELRRTMIGEILVLVEPIDASVTLAGRSLEFVGQPQKVLAGSQQLVISRPGFASVEDSVEIRAGRSTTVEHQLERLSAVAHLRIRPAGAEVFVNGQPAQIAERDLLEGSVPEEDIAIDGLISGNHVIEVRLAEYRPLRLTLQTDELDDYRLPPAALELMEGEIQFQQLPEDSIVVVNSEVADPVESGSGGARLRLAPGDYIVEVRKPGVGGFRQQVSIGDQEVLELVVELRPTIAFLGVLGSDRLAAKDLSATLGERFGLLAQWIWNDYSLEATGVLDAAGMTAPELRRVSQLESLRAEPDWSDVQKQLDDTFQASLYLIAVLGDDLYATSADLWLWSPSPWPARPGRRTVPLQGDGTALARLVESFDSAIVPSAVYLGARFMASSASEAPVAISVAAGGPASTAGLVVGDRVTTVNGQSVATTADLHLQLRSSIGGEALLEVASGPESREIRVSIAEAPGVFELSDTRVVDQVLAARLSNVVLRPDGRVPLWLLQLNQAALYLRAQAFEAAVPLLRRIEAPEGPGLSRAMVDYWLGTTLLSVDPSTYGTAAKAALERALSEEGARLYRPDGPLLAPRAKARLAELARLTGG